MKSKAPFVKFTKAAKGKRLDAEDAAEKARGKTPSRAEEAREARKK